MLPLNLESILNFDKWQIVQDSIARATGLAIITVDYKGVPVGSHSECRDFCHFIRHNLNYAKYCNRCDAHGGLEAARTSAPYIYLCHCNIVDLAIPISIDGRYIGAVMAGQVRLDTNDVNIGLEKIYVSPASGLALNVTLREMYEKIPVMKYTQIKTCADLLLNLLNYLVNESLHKNLAIDLYEQLKSREDVSGDPTGQMSSIGNYPATSIKRLQNNLDSVVIKAYMRDMDLRQDPACKNPTLTPAFQYIYENIGKAFSAKKLAQLCHVSQSYFSRLFARETGVSLSTYVSLHKVDMSKQLLERSNMSVAQISNALGFSEPGYFIKIFKKHERITPAVYRKLIRPTGAASGAPTN